MRRVIKDIARTCRVVARDLLGNARALPTDVLHTDAVGVWCLRCGATTAIDSTIWHSRGEVLWNCASCLGVRQLRAATVRLGPHEGALRDAVLALKHEGDRAMGRSLGRALAKQCEACGVTRVDRESLLVTAVPMPFGRRCERGVDHAAVIGRSVARALGIRFEQLCTQRDGPTQASLTAAARRRRSGRFELRAGLSLPTERLTVLLVDDVLTTGATMESVARLLGGAAHHIRVIGVVATVANP